MMETQIQSLKKDREQRHLQQQQKLEQQQQQQKQLEMEQQQQAQHQQQQQQQQMTAEMQSHLVPQNVIPQTVPPGMMINQPAGYSLTAGEMFQTVQAAGEQLLANLQGTSMSF